MAFTTLADHCLEVAAGMPLNRDAYTRWETKLNMAKVRAMGRAYREGWLHNVMSRITPITVRDADDYVMMADLFVLDATEAKALLEKMSADLTNFAIAAGRAFDCASMQPHVTMYNEVASFMAQKFEIEIPAPFASKVVKATDKLVTEAGYIRQYMRTEFPRPYLRAAEADPMF